MSDSKNERTLVQEKKSGVKEKLFYIFFGVFMIFGITYQLYIWLLADHITDNIGESLAYTALDIFSLWVCVLLAKDLWQQNIARRKQQKPRDHLEHVDIESPDEDHSM
ncbi:hypothetical protein KDW_41250 [Dictyobacter vulcani]|uniref:Uncharacterized protein n=1 Tax=Dictyobacter vulcani TaxID=2607529 RepID=A0A5J4KQT7_9CHLR|nr:hypothetical protein [Dictyobacter vulcani]GER89963.1 hypothetical protein KDW_41250 [Dictyobacter vulcani]